MILTKGIELIPKRDKVTIASNILGKWEDYSIDTYQGKVLKEAAERYKVLLKEGKQKEVADDVPSLKAMLLKSETSTVEKITTDDFWATPVKLETAKNDPDVETKSTEVTSTVLDDNSPVEVTESEKWHIPLEDNAPKYFIKAYTAKSTGKQMYLASWDDSTDWMISAVPFATTKERCEYLIDKATKQIEKANAESKIRSRFPKDLKFELVLVK